MGLGLEGRQLTVSALSKTISHIKSFSLSVKHCMLMWPSDPGKVSYVAKIERIEVDERGSNVKVQVRWYYRPEESIGGRRQFHGEFWFCLLEQADLRSENFGRWRRRYHRKERRENVKI
jgi:hypothetical protein